MEAIPYEDIPTIRFDHARAEAAAVQLILTARSLRGAVALMEGDLPEVTADWRGRLRRTFDYESARHDLTARKLAETLMTAAVVIRTRQIEARAVNLKFREDFLRDWHERQQRNEWNRTHPR
jgi:hypothetical protein